MATENLNPNWKKVSNININIANVIILLDSFNLGKVVVGGGDRIPPALGYQ